MREKTKDEILLLVTGVSIFIIGIPFSLFLRKHMSDEWSLFVWNSLGFIIALVWLPFAMHRLFSRWRKFKIILFQLLLGVFIVGLGALVFKLRILPQPRTAMPYMLAWVIIGAPTLTVMEYCIRKWKVLK